MTNYELAQTMAKLGAVTAAGLQYGKFVTAAFDGQVLNRPSQPSGQVAVKEALLVQYAGVYALPPSVPVLGKADVAARRAARLPASRSPSQVTATVVGPDGTATPARRRQQAARHLPLRLGELRRRGHVALERPGDRRPEPRLDRRPDVRVRPHALGPRRPEDGVRGERAAASGSRSRAPRRSRSRSRPRTARSSRRCPRPSSTRARSRSPGTARPRRAQGAVRRVRRHRHRDELDRHRRPFTPPSRLHR